MGFEFDNNYPELKLAVKINFIVLYIAQILDVLPAATTMETYTLEYRLFPVSVFCTASPDKALESCFTGARGLERAATTCIYSP